MTDKPREREKEKETKCMRHIEIEKESVYEREKKEWERGEGCVVQQYFVIVE